MGDANKSRASKGKEFIGGLLKRVTGGKDEVEETAPRSGVSLRDRFSALNPNAVPTDALPRRFQDNVQNPDGNKKAEVIHTSTVRSSGSVRFSDRLGLAVASESRSFERRIPFYEDSYDEEESCTSSSEGAAETVADTVSESKYGIGNRVIFEEEAMVPFVADNAAEICEEMNVPETVTEMPHGDDNEYDAIAEVARADVMPDSEENIRAEENYDIAAEEVHTAEQTGDAIQHTEHTIQQEQEVMTQTAKAECSHDDFDDYDFLPRRGSASTVRSAVQAAESVPVTVPVPMAETEEPVNEMISAESTEMPEITVSVPMAETEEPVNEMISAESTEMPEEIMISAQPAVQAEQIITPSEIQQPVTEVREATLAERLKARLSDVAQPKKQTEVQTDEPIYHKSRSSLLEKAMSRLMKKGDPNPMQNSEQNETNATKMSLAGCGATEECITDVSHDLPVADEIMSQIAVDDEAEAAVCEEITEADAKHSDLTETGPSIIIEAEVTEEATGHSTEDITECEDTIFETDAITDNVTACDEMVPEAEMVEWLMQDAPEREELMSEAEAETVEETVWMMRDVLESEEPDMTEEAEADAVADNVTAYGETVLEAETVEETVEWLMQDTPEHGELMSEEEAEVTEELAAELTEDIFESEGLDTVPEAEIAEELAAELTEDIFESEGLDTVPEAEIAEEAITQSMEYFMMYEEMPGAEAEVAEDMAARPIDLVMEYAEPNIMASEETDTIIAPEMYAYEVIVADGECSSIHDDVACPEVVISAIDEIHDENEMFAAGFASLETIAYTGFEEKESYEAVNVCACATIDRELVSVANEEVTVEMSDQTAFSDVALIAHHVNEYINAMSHHNIVFDDTDEDLYTFDAEYCTDTDVLENEMSAILKGVVADGMIIPAVDILHDEAESSKANASCETTHGIRFSFMSGGNNSPPTDVRFIWGH